jgi:hypothetical protein
MKAQHTPAPWYIAHHTDVQGEKSIDVRHCLDSAPKQPEIHQIARLHEADEANARLIAAAPDMLDALERLANDYAALMNSQGAAIDIGQPGSEFTAGEWVGSRLQSPMQEAWKAIAKAKGEA